MNKFIAIDDATIEELIGGRLYQSTDFGIGASLVGLLKGQSDSLELGGITSIKKNGGVYLLSPGVRPKPKFLVIDSEESRAFLDLSSQDALFAFQKLLRFCVKWWAGAQGMTWSEKIINNSSKAVIFPFRYQPHPYRLVIEREPWKDRLAKRDLNGKFLLVYKAGQGGGDSSAEEASTTNFRKVIESYKDAILELQKQRAAVAPASGPLNATDLDGSSQPALTSLFRSFDDWMLSLTDQQREFVQAPLVGAHRIEGAAGTGKTLSLMLKALYELRRAAEDGRECNIVFITHSEATRASIANVLDVVDSDNGFQHRDRASSQQSLSVRTLSQLCSEKLRHAISESEFIDRDALESKGYQRLYIAEVIEEAVAQDLPTHSKFMSQELVAMMHGDQSWHLAQMFQHEISVLIKGRASEIFDVYRDVKPLKYGLPASTQADKAFVFSVFNRYRAKLAMMGQFDTDDVVLSAIGQLDTPIWKRRRSREGFDALFIDETHLFNINELHLFHYFTKADVQFPIAYSIDKSQAVGDPGWTTAEMEQAVTSSESNGSGGDNVKVGTIFRSSPEIVDLALCIVASGATLFTNFENPVAQSASAFTAKDEALSSPPVYRELPNEDSLVEAAFERAEIIREELGCGRAGVLICALDESIAQKLLEFAVEKKRPVKALSKRGDAVAVEQATAAGMHVVGHVDYVGGLEFAAVVLVGADDGRVPPVQGANAEAARHFLTYAAHNRLYVAVTRARYRVEILGESARGISRILRPAVEAGLIAVARP